MPRNVEIKARARNLAQQARLAERLADGGSRKLVQEDTFFRVTTGRLKLRVFEDGTGELIQYDRADSIQPAESRYIRSSIEDPNALKNLLARALGIAAAVRKTRTVYVRGNVRIHLDRVEGLGEFIELEVVLGEADNLDAGVAMAEEWMEKLEIAEADLVAEAYVDLQKRTL